MKGYLLVNSFQKKEKYFDLYNLFEKAAIKQNIDFEVIRSIDLLKSIQEGYSNLPDFGIIYDKDYYFAKSIENSGLRLMNSAEANILCDDKILTSIRLEEHNVPMPKTIFGPKRYYNDEVDNKEVAEKILKLIDFPIIVKKNKGSFGLGVYLINNMEEFLDLLNSEIKNGEFLVQEYIEESKGTDFRINIVGDKVVSTVKRNNPNDFRSNVTNGGTMVKCDADEEVKKIALDASKALGMDFCGADILLSNRGPLVCEVNANPHFRTTLDATGLNMAEDIIEYAIREASK